MGWTNEQFMKEATIYVQDERIAALDAKSGDLLTRLNSVGAAGSADGEPDCALLADLRGTMASLVKAQEEKWRHMFDKVEAALK
jgi:hypothetical protein